MSPRGKLLEPIRKLCGELRRTSPNSEWDLLPLTPTYLEDEHAPYVTALCAALENEHLRNIALSGNFGVGKSSILQGLADHSGQRALQLSLSSLSSWKLKQSDAANAKLETTKTNRIQQELVKQLLYSADTPQRRYSRFRRIEHFDFPREFLTSTLIGVVAATLFLLTGWTNTILAEFPQLPGVTAWTHLGAWGVATGLAFTARRLMFGRMQIKQLSAGPAAITLDRKSETFFDQYLDEIVYFFETSNYDVVLFEDIDRFEDVYIFETLRALNTLLNTSPKIRRPIRFIYAI